MLAKGWAPPTRVLLGKTVNAPNPEDASLRSSGLAIRPPNGHQDVTLARHASGIQGLSRTTGSRRYSTFS